MVRQLTNEDILNAKGVHFYNKDVIYVEPQDDDNVYGISEDNLNWWIKDNFYDYFESSLMLSYFTSITKEEAITMIAEWKIKADISEKRVNHVENAKINQAIYFATERHSGQVRKGTTIPFIVHPMEVMVILSAMNADTNLIIAGLLHDTVEDTNTSIEEIEALFGDDVAHLVKAHSEDKSKTWDERKETEIEETSMASLRIKKLVLADKLANLRSLFKDYTAIGNELWERFNAGVEKQAWYYGKMTEALADLQDYLETSGFYWELLGLYKDVFVTFWLDEENEFLYQKSIDGEIYRLKKGNPEWVCCEGGINRKAKIIERRYAEQTEDNWNAPFWNVMNQDMVDGTYTLYSSETRSLKISILNKCITLFAHDYGKNCRVINGKEEYEFAYSLDEENSYHLLVHLRMKYEISNGVESVFIKEFGYDDGSVRFKDFCDILNIQYIFCSM